MADIARLADHSNDAHAWSPVECLTQVLADLESGEAKADRAIVILIADHPSDSRALVKQFEYDIYRSRISRSTDEAFIFTVIAQRRIEESRG